MGGDITLTAGAMGVGCSKPSATSVSCPRLVAGRSMRMEVLAGPLGDSVSVGSTVPVGVDLFGEDGADSLTGGPGDDFIEPGAGLDVPKGGPGRDRISSTMVAPTRWRSTSACWAAPPSTAARTTRGSRTSPGRRSATRSLATPGPNDIDGLGGVDSLDGFIGNYVLDGGGGDDASLTGDENDDVLIGGAGVTDQVTGGSGSDTVSNEDRTGGLAIDAGTGVLPGVTAFGSIENVRGTSGDDTLTGALPPNSITGFEGGPGDDGLVGNGAANVLDGGAGKDSVSGAGGADLLRGGTQDDVVVGGAGSDTMLARRGRRLVRRGRGRGGRRRLLDGYRPRHLRRARFADRLRTDADATDTHTDADADADTT